MKIDTQTKTITAEKVPTYNYLYSRLKEMFRDEVPMNLPDPMEAVSREVASPDAGIRRFIVTYKMVNGWKLVLDGVEYKDIVGEDAFVRRLSRTWGSMQG
jgi:hypothetical protein